MGDQVNPPVPPELCGIKGAMFDTTTPTGSCAYLKNHEGKHSWQPDAQ